MLSIKLNAIPQEEQEQQQQIKTQHALLKVYNSLFCLSYYKIDTAPPKRTFQTISNKFNQENKPDMSCYKPFSEEQYEDISKKHNNYFSNLFDEKSKKNCKFISKEQFQQMMAQRGSILKQISPPQLILKSPPRQQLQQNHIQEEPKYEINKVEQETIDQSLNGIMSRLKQFDEQRSQIKTLAYTHQEEQLNEIYQKWAKVHSQAKQTLELYLTKISDGKSMVDIFKSLSRNKTIQGEIQGYSKNQLMSKLDSYLQSLYLDERQLLIYSSSRSHHNSPRKQNNKNYLTTRQQKDNLININFEGTKSEKHSRAQRQIHF